MRHDPVWITAGLVVILAMMCLIAFVIYVLKGAPTGRLAAVLTAVGTVLATIPAILWALHG